MAGDDFSVKFSVSGFGPVAARRAHRGRVLGVDLSAAVMEQARREAATEDLTDIAFEQGEAQVHPFSGPGFDIIISRGGVMFFGDMVAASTHLHDALTPGGRLTFLGPQPGKAVVLWPVAAAVLLPELEVSAGSPGQRRGVRSTRRSARTRSPWCPLGPWPGTASSASGPWRRPIRRNS
ncbi:class I SAM-dependent methyltransferase [Streptomyces sp. B1I3]|uniref:class I SAM-dependent methyltransferase n=1 Tax=Streptomyces sp. B1I3 TaxID=3042264 RepID=UPI002789F564|nr:class I SAM-dependent methyltransferase [Streptomyces sp. B1I3]MDQ0791643.1 SAM-dependent methyltransferase [Streptomyces sp. B1I3]